MINSSEITVLEENITQSNDITILTCGIGWSWI